MEILRCRRTHHGLLGENHDTGVIGAHANLILGADHAKAFYATELRFLDDKFLVAIIEHAAQVGHNDLLASSHIGCATHDLLGLALAKVYGCDMQMIAIGMGLTSENFTHEETLQSSFDGLHLFERVHLKSSRRQCVGGFLRRKVEVDVFFQPLI